VTQRHHRVGSDPTTSSRWAHRVVRAGELVVGGAILAAISLVAVHLSGADRTRLELSATTRPAAAPDRGSRRSRLQSDHLSSTAGGLHVRSVSPEPGSTGVSPTAPVVVRLSAALARGSAHPTIDPPLTGRWQRVGTDEFRFSPTVPAMPLATETVTIPGGRHGVRAADGKELPATVVDHWQVQDGSVLRLQQVLAKLGYLPVNWVRTSPVVYSEAAGTQDLRELFKPPAGTFSWRYPDTPSQLQAAWQVGVDNHVTTGAMVAFERHDGLPAYTSIRPQMWTALLTAEANHTMNPEGYTYALVSQVQPESLTLWHDGTDVYTSVANTGIAQTPTPVGTFFVYRRFASTTMEGTNPDGRYYVDHGVRWVNYFDGGVAIHGFVRASYGFPQSLGCVELPVAHAAVAWNWIHYGTVVTVLPEPTTASAS